MNFKLFFEARQHDIDLIANAIDKVDERPFNELFGNDERFLRKVLNPDFSKALKALNMDKDKFNFQKREYDGKHINTYLKERISENLEELKSLEHRQFFYKLYEELINSLAKDIIELSPKVERYEDHIIISSEKKTGIIGDYVKSPKTEKLPKSDWNTEDAKLFIDIIFDYVDKHKQIPDSIIFGTRVSSSGNRVINGYMQMLYSVKEKPTAQLKHLRKMKQLNDQNNISYYLLFSRHPIDVLRMSDHKNRISSCHRLDGGSYKHCAIADAQNDGGIIYLIKGSSGMKAERDINAKEIFEDPDRNIQGIRPIGRIRLRRFVDLKTGDDFAVLARHTMEEHYGLFTKELWDVCLRYIQKNQSIFENPPDPEYALKYIVMAGGTYTDNASPAELMNAFFGNNIYTSIKTKNTDEDEDDGGNWEDECNDIIESYSRRLMNVGLDASAAVNGNTITLTISFSDQLDWDDIDDNLVYRGTYGTMNHVDEDKFDKFITNKYQEFRKLFESDVRDVGLVGISIEYDNYGPLFEVRWKAKLYEPEFLYHAFERVLTLPSSIAQVSRTMKKDVLELMKTHINEYVEEDYSNSQKEL